VCVVISHISSLTFLTLMCGKSRALYVYHTHIRESVTKKYIFCFFFNFFARFLVELYFSSFGPVVFQRGKCSSQLSTALPCIFGQPFFICKYILYIIKIVYYR